MGTHHAELEQWLARLDAIGGKLTGQVTEGWEKINTRIQQQQKQNAAQSQKQQEELQKQLQEELHGMATAAARIQQTLADVADQAAAMQSHVNDSFSEAQTTLQERFAGLEHGLNSLSSVLQQLGDQSVVVQQVQPPKTPVKRGWFNSRRAR